MATKIPPRDAFPSSHRVGAIAPRKHRIDPAALRPIRTVCAWCARYNRPTAVLVDVPIDDRGLSHGICSACRTGLREAWTRSRTVSSASPTWR